jgi:RecA-family ATPase
MWLWEGRVPLGELTTFAGRGEDGKTTVVLDLVAQLSRGELAGDRHGRKGKTLYFSDEASFHHVITPRYAAARGAAGGLYTIDFADIDHHGRTLGRPFNLKRDIRVLRETIEQEQIDLLVFDPIDMLLGGVDTHRNNEVRAALSLIMSAGCTVIGIQHVTKNSNVAFAGDRVMGSAAFRNYPRSVLMVSTDRSDRNVIVLAHDKSNYGPRQKSLTLQTVPSHIQGFARVKWLEEIPATADDLLIARRGPNLVQQCTSWLEQLLTDNGPMLCRDIVALGKAEGYGRTTIYDSRGLLGSTTVDGHWTL